MRDYGRFLSAVPQEPILGYKVLSNGSRAFLTYSGDKGLLTVAPNRTGKDSSVISVNAMCHRGTLVLCEPKGESCNEMGLAWWRHEVLKQETHVYDPLHVVKDSRIPPPRASSAGSPSPLRAGFNPIAMIGRSRFAAADSKMITRTLVAIEGTNPFFSRTAGALLAGFMCFAALDPAYPLPRTMRSVWKDLTESSHERLKMMMSVMSQSEVADGYPKRIGQLFLSASDETLRDVLSTLRSQAGEILDDPHILECLSYDSFDFGQLQRKPCSVFIVLPGWAQDIYANFFRLLLSCMFTLIERVGLPPAGSKPLKTMVILNEFASLRKADFIREAVPRLPGYGVQFWPFVQDLGQLFELYGQGWTTFPANAGVTQAFGGTGDTFTAEFLSKRSGTVTDETVSTTDQRKGGGGSLTMGNTGRPAIFPYQIETMNKLPGDKLKQVLFYTGSGWMYGQRLRYYTDFPDFMAYLAELDRRFGPASFELHS